ncbi:hypothetical protein [Candidatus Stoquefichus sp. SB1]|uniref:hypothetical protein n=1 Tax=Candidatus Stoquefichus sp. SB1 TaxID=1658109 RepID=UPI00067F510A|nr:hypothetical protein [Candidatus Stoquefichus sp. SB1]
MNETLQQLKIQLSTGKKTYRMLASLDSNSKKYQEVLNEFMPKIKKMLDDAKKNLQETSQNAPKLKKEMTNLYNTINVQRKNIEELKNNIEEYDIKIKKWTIDIQQYTQARDNCDKELKNMRSKKFIPYVGLIMTIKDKRSGKYNRYLQEFENAVDMIHQLENHISEARVFCQKNQEECNKIYKNIDDDTKKLAILRQKISDSVNQVLYLSILEERLSQLGCGVVTSSKILELLDKEPEVIHFDNEIYMTIINEYNKNPDSFKDYIVKGDEEFL